MRPERLLTRLARADFVLVREADGARYGAYPGGDRRRRPVARIPAAIIKGLIADGALSDADGERVVLSPAGRARVERAAVTPDEAWRAQHDELVDRSAMDRDGDVYAVRGLAPGGAMARLARLKEAEGRAFFAAEEIAAGARLAPDWAVGQQGLVRGADWTAPPRGNTPRGSSAEIVRGAVIDARAGGCRAARAGALRGRADQGGVP